MNKGVENTCKNCGSVYKTLRPQVFCCADCYQSWRRTEDAKDMRRATAICRHCGKKFYARGRFNGHERKFCSKTCANRHQQQGKTYNNWINKTCPTCGALFTVKQTNKKKIYCSKNCYSQAQIQYHEGRRVGDRKTAKLRRERLATPIDKDYIKALRVIQRGDCAFCGRPMEGHETIEHLIPVSKGGKNDWWNVVLCCKHCNSQKGAQELIDYSFKICEPKIVDKTLFITYSAHKLATKSNNYKTYGK